MKLYILFKYIFHFSDRHCKIAEGDDVRVRLFDYILKPYIFELQNFIENCRPKCNIRMIDFVIDMLAISSYKISHTDFCRNNGMRYGYHNLLTNEEFNMISGMFDGDFIR